MKTATETSSPSGYNAFLTAQYIPTFIKSYCRHLEAEAVQDETVCSITQLSIPEDVSLHQHRCKNLQFHKTILVGSITWTERLARIDNGKPARILAFSKPEGSRS
jgi:hypothetical protein